MTRLTDRVKKFYDKAMLKIKNDPVLKEHIDFIFNDTHYPKVNNYQSLKYVQGEQILYYKWIIAKDYRSLIHWLHFHKQLKKS